MNYMVKQSKEKSKEAYDLGKYLEDIALYQYGGVAGRLASNEQTAPFAVGGLEKLTAEIKKKLEEKGLSTKILEGFRAGSMASREGINTAIGAYSNQYEDALGMLDVTDFYNLRFEQLKYALGEEKAVEAKVKFDKYKGQTVSSILKKISQANAILKDNTGLFDEKQKNEAKETLEKLRAIATLIELPEMINYEKLMPGATKDVYKQRIKDALDKA